MNQPPKETWCQSCEGEGFVRDSLMRRCRCEDCGGSGETGRSLAWLGPEDEDDR